MKVLIHMVGGMHKLPFVVMDAAEFMHRFTLSPNYQASAILRTNQVRI